MLSFQRFECHRWWIAAASSVVIVCIIALAARKRIDDLPTQWRKINEQLEARRWAKAELLLSRWVDRFPNDGNAWVRLGSVLYEMRRYDEALSAFQRVKKSERAWPLAQTWMGQIARLMGNLPDAEHAFWEAAQQQPTAVEPRTGLVALFTVQQRPNLARGVLWELYRLTHDVHHLAALTALEAIGFDDVDALAPLSADFLSKSPRDVWLRRARGLILLKQGHPAEALPFLEEVTLLDSDFVGRFALAECHITLGEAVDLDTLFDSLPNEPQFQGRRLVLKARVAEAHHQPDQALGYWKQAVTIDPQNRVSQYRLGQALIQINQKQLAQQHLKRAQEMGDRHRHLRLLLLQVGPHQPADAGVYEMIAKLCLESGLSPEARAWYEETIGIDPTRMTAQAALAQLPALTAPERLPTMLPPRPVSRYALEELASGAKRSVIRSALKGPQFEEIATRAGLTFQHVSGATIELFIADTMSGGVGLIDYDRDGWLDLYLVSGCTLPIKTQSTPAPNKLYHNLHNGMFEDVTTRAGVAGRGYGMGCTVGDFDDDGHDDLFVTGFRNTLLYRNRGDGTFEDVTEKAGVYSSRWCTAAGFADLDGDRDLDLVVVSYVDADPNRLISCKDSTSRRIHCTPSYYRPQSSHLFRNNGNGTFTDVAQEAGLRAAMPGLGLALADFDGDRRLDIFIANDAVPNALFRNLGNLRFEDISLIAGLAYNAEGHATASMGVVAEDFDGDGLMDIFHTNLINEGSTLARNLGSGRFMDMTESMGLLAPSRAVTGFGVAALDADNDGRLDLFAANGHVDDMPWQNRPMAEVPHFYQSVAPGRFELASANTTGAYFTRPIVGRGTAVGDFDNDGRLDIVVVHRDALVGLLHNVSNAGHALGLRLKGKTSASLPVGARVTCHAGDKTIVRWVTTGTGYLSANDTRLWFGLGNTTSVDSLEVQWPSGLDQKWTNVVGDRIFEVVEGGDPIECMATRSRSLSP